MASSESNIGTQDQGVDFKRQLDEASIRSRQPQKQEEEDTSETIAEAIVDKVSQYIPAVKKVIGKPEEPEPKAETPPPSDDVAPKRPVDDEKITQFLRDQHKSMPIDKLDE